MADWRELAADPADPLASAAKLQRAAAEDGFDWDELAPMWAKLREEIAELQAAIDQGVAAEIEAELGDLLFMVLNLARRLEVDADAALHGTNLKFLRRLRVVQAELAAAGRQLNEAGIDELEALWQAAKDSGKSRPTR